MAVVKRYIPPEIIKHATLDEPLETAFEYDEGIFEFGERLILVSALVLCGLYISRAERDAATRSDHYSDFIRAMIFQRGFDRGLGCAVFQRISQVGGSLFASLQGDYRPVMAFNGLRRHGAANTVRARMRDPLEARLCDLVRSVRFLKRLRFASDGGISFDQERVELWPFLRWDGQDLLRIREPRDRNPAGLPEALEWVSGDENFSLIEPLSTEKLNRLRHVAQLVAHLHREDPVVVVPLRFESVIPLFADTHPQMCDLAQLIQKKANRDTKAKLLMPYLRKERGMVTPEEARAVAKDPRAVENAVIRQCVETDPVAVLKAYLESEPGDIGECLMLLTGDRRKANDGLASINKRVDEFRKALTPLYPDRDELVDKEGEEYRALLAAKEVARLLGFRIIEQNARDPIDAHISRVEAFEQYVRSKDHDLAKVATGLLECAKIAEEVLKFLVAFYTTLKFYDPLQGDGIMAGTREAAAAGQEQAWSETFDRITKRFAHLHEDSEVISAVRRHLDRPMWSAKALEGHIRAMDDFRRNWRNDYAHERGIIDRDAPLIVGRFLDFLRWLRDPARSGAHRDRIYPAVLHLNVLTMNQCGITSVKYGLTEMSNPKDRISLYTKQPLGHLAGVFYGLPNQNKSQEDLWLDPVLLPSTAFPEVKRHGKRSKDPVRSSAPRA